jgi:arylsulfatase A-like enzyme
VLLLATLTACSPREPSSPCPAPEPAPAQDPPRDARRVLLVTLEATRADALGAWGDERGLTPGLDHLAERSLRFSRAYAHAPWTMPSVGTLMTSLLPRDHGVRQWTDDFVPGQVTLATALHDAGWRTEAIVAHVAFDPAETAFEVGFDRFEMSFRSQPDGAGSPVGIETSTHLTDLAVPTLERLQAGAEPFLLWLHYFDPHDTYLPHDDLLDLGDDDPSLYASELAWTDTQLRPVLDLALADPDLVVVVVADHGEEMFDHGDVGHTRTLYEELVHVPLLLRAPGITAGVDDAPVGTIDLAPTLLELVGVPVPVGFAGRSLLPAPVGRDLFSETSRLWHVRAMLRWPWKVVWDLDRDAGELYDVCSDPREQDDRWGDEPDLARALQSSLAETYPEVPPP